MRYPNVTSLFKYRSINQCTLDALRDRKLWVASPNSFNDPFDTNTDNYVDELSPEVSYTRLWPVVDNTNLWDQSNLEAFGRELEQLMFVKAEEWRYEREWRTVYRSVNCLKDYPGPLKSIIWGLCMDEKDKVKIRNLVKGSNVIFKQAKRARGEFRISIEEEHI